MDIGIIYCYAPEISSLLLLQLQLEWATSNFIPTYSIWNRYQLCLHYLWTCKGLYCRYDKSASRQFCIDIRSSPNSEWNGEGNKASTLITSPFSDLGDFLLEVPDCDMEPTCVLKSELANLASILSVLLSLRFCIDYSGILPCLCNSVDINVILVQLLVVVPSFSLAYTEWQYARYYWTVAVWGVVCVYIRQWLCLPCDCRDILCFAVNVEFLFDKNWVLISLEKIVTSLYPE
jgi:hypothetical protein